MSHNFNRHFKLEQHTHGQMASNTQPTVTWRIFKEPPLFSYRKRKSLKDMLPVKQNFKGFQRLNGRTQESYRSENVKKTSWFDDLLILTKNSALTLVNVAPLSIKVHLNYDKRFVITSLVYCHAYETLKCRRINHSPSEQGLEGFILFRITQSTFQNCRSPWFHD